MEESEEDRSGRGIHRLPRARDVMDLDRDERRRRVLWAAVRSVGIAAFLILVYSLLPFDWNPVAQIAIGVSVGVILLGIVGMWQVRAVATAEFPELRGFEALACSVALLLVVFASTYLSLSNRDVGAFSESLDHTGALYFALTTLTTVGFGDIAARSNAARITVMLQMVANVAVLGVVVKLIVGIIRKRMSVAGPGSDR